MRKLIIALLIVISTSCYSQKKTHGYVNIGPTAFFNEDLEHYFGATASFSAELSNYSTLGVLFDLYIFQKERNKMVPAHLDLRIYPAGLKKHVTPFFALQPGYVLSNTKIGSTTVQGAFAINTLVGLHGKKSGPGVTFSAGYSNIGFTTKTLSTKTVNRYGGLKIAIALAF